MLYLLGVSTGDFSEALEVLLGSQPAGFSANTVIRLKEKWTQEHEQWCQRSLAGKQYAYATSGLMGFTSMFGWRTREISVNVF